MNRSKKSKTPAILLNLSALEYEEIIDNIKRRSSIHEKIIKILLEEEEVYTNKGRLNKSSLIRISGLKASEISEVFADIQKELMK